MRRVAFRTDGDYKIRLFTQGHRNHVQNTLTLEVTEIDNIYFIFQGYQLQDCNGRETTWH